MTRPIDADALKDEICKQYRHFDQRIAISPVFEAIKKAPTVDAIPVQWIKEWCYRYRFYAGVEIEDLLEDWEAERKEKNDGERSS